MLCKVSCYSYNWCVSSSCTRTDWLAKCVCAFQPPWCPALLQGQGLNVPRVLLVSLLEWIKVCGENTTVNSRSRAGEGVLTGKVSFGKHNSQTGTATWKGRNTANRRGLTKLLELNVSFIEAQVPEKLHHPQPHSPTLALMGAWGTSRGSRGGRTSAESLLPMSLCYCLPHRPPLTGWAIYFTNKIAHK